MNSPGNSTSAPLPARLSPPGEILFSQATILGTVDRLAEAIGRTHAGHELCLVAVLEGAMIFAADLLRRLRLRTRLATVRASSYRGTSREPSSLQQEWIEPDIRGRRVLLVDDILDSGRTLDRIRRRFLELEPSRLEICVLLDKPSRRVVEVPVEFTGLTVPDRFVVGYGLDYDGRYRNLPYIAALDPDDVSQGHS
jgi:hypoxanthine phosphoribosyltransferase